MNGENKVKIKKQQPINVQYIYRRTVAGEERHSAKMGKGGWGGAVAKHVPTVRHRLMRRHGAKKGWGKKRSPEKNDVDHATLCCAQRVTVIKLKKLPAAPR